MMSNAVATSIAERRSLLSARVNVHGASLQEQVTKAGRRLPARVHRDLGVMAQAEAIRQNPKLAR
jgi:hypothetical protein